MFQASTPIGPMPVIHDFRCDGMRVGEGADYPN
jgi:hypothetical protein